jgi:hypothetical protein
MTAKEHVAAWLAFGLVTAVVGLIGYAVAPNGGLIVLVILAALAWVAGATGYAPGGVVVLTGAIVMGIVFGASNGARVDAEYGYRGPDGGPSTYALFNIAFTAAAEAIIVLLGWAVGWASRRWWFTPHS